MSTYLRFREMQAWPPRSTSGWRMVGAKNAKTTAKRRTERRKMPKGRCKRFVFMAAKTIARQPLKGERKKRDGRGKTLAGEKGFGQKSG